MLLCAPPFAPFGLKLGTDVRLDHAYDLSDLCRRAFSVASVYCWLARVLGVFGDMICYPASSAFSAMGFVAPPRRIFSRFLFSKFAALHLYRR